MRGLLEKPATYIGSGFNMLFGSIWVYLLNMLFSVPHNDVELTRNKLKLNFFLSSFYFSFKYFLINCNFKNLIHHYISS